MHLPRQTSAALGLLLLGLFAFAGCGGIAFEVKIPRALIEKQVARQFPTVRNQGLMSVALSHPVLDFQGSRNRLGVTADAEVRLFGALPFRGRMAADGTLRYVPEKGTFVFDSVHISKFEIAGLPRTQLDTVASLATGALLDALGGLEVYRLDPHDTKERAAAMVLRGIRVADDGVVVKLGIGK